MLEASFQVLPLRCARFQADFLSAFVKIRRAHTHEHTVCFFLALSGEGRGRGEMLRFSQLLQFGNQYFPSVSSRAASLRFVRACGPCGADEPRAPPSAPAPSNAPLTSQNVEQKTCNSEPGWGVHLNPENTIDYATHPECRLNPLYAEMGDYAPAP